MSLPNLNIHDANWIELRVWLLDEVRKQTLLLKSDLDPLETAKCRGRIAALESVLNLENNIIKKRNQQA
jgi:hypothetical protein